MTAQDRVKSIVELVNEANTNGLNDDIRECIEKEAYALFFDYEGISYYTASRMLKVAGINNSAGEMDSFGPLSWGIHTSNGSVYFG